MKGSVDGDVELRLEAGSAEVSSFYTAPHCAAPNDCLAR